MRRTVSIAAASLGAAAVVTALVSWQSGAPERPWETRHDLAENRSEGRAVASDGFVGKLAAQLDEGTLRTESVPGGAVLHNRLQRVRAEVRADAVKVSSTSANEGPGDFELRVAGWGREGDLRPAGEGEVVVDRDLGRVEVRRRALTECYSNAADGVRQDFVMPSRPAGKGALRLEIILAGAEARPSAGGALVTLPGGRELTYDRLRVSDAQGTRIAARMEVTNANSLAIVVDDAAAAYPLLIDPTISDADWQSMGGMPGANNFVYAALYHAGSLYIGGDFTTVGTVIANRVARWDGSEWSSLGTGAQNGTNGSVRALAAIGDKVYVAGHFPQAGGAVVNYIAAWDTLSSTWSDLDGGVDGQLYSLTVDGTTLYAGGFFNNAGTTPAVSAKSIAAYDTLSDTWSALGGGVDGQVRAIAVSGSIIYAGGTFTTVENTTVPASKVAKFEGVSWAALGAGANNHVFALAVLGGELYVGGVFDSAGGFAIANIARWTEGAPGTWSSVGFLNDTVNGLVVSGGTLYAAGNFSNVGGSGSHYAAKWNDVQSKWDPLGGGLNAASNCVAASATDVCFGGSHFTEAGGKAAVRVARWDGSEWWGLGDGMDSSVLAIEVIGYDAYIAGGFRSTRDGPAAYITRWNGGTFYDVGGGVGSTVNALAASGTDLYVGGAFYEAGGQPADHVARWDGSQWWPMGSITGVVNALAVSGATVYAGEAVGFSDSRVVSWGGASWSQIGATLRDGRVNALYHDGTYLYAGGGFTNDGASPLSYFIRYEAGSWVTVGSGTNGEVRALAAIGSDIYVGGEFVNAGGVVVYNIAKWNEGAGWSALTSGTNGAVRALAASGTDLYVVGEFEEAGGVPVNRIAVWDTLAGTWSDCGSGADGNVYAVDTMGDDLYVGGGFGAVGGKVSAYAAWADSTAPWVVSTAPAGPSPTNADSVDFTVVFSEQVTATDVATSDFALTKSGADGTISGVSGTGATYTVTVSTVTGDGTLRLDLAAAPTITDLVSHALVDPYTSGVPYAIDNTPPGVPSVPDLEATSDTGVLDTDDITNDATPTFTGTAEAGITVTVISSVDNTLGTTTAGGGGDWSFTPSVDITEGPHDITASGTDAAGNSSPASAALAVTIDLAAAAPSVPDLEAASDTGLLDTDDITNDATPTFAGTAEAGASVTVTSSINGAVGSTTADGSGNWTVTVSSLDQGSHSITATQTDLAGNGSPASAALAVTIDLAAAAPSVPDLEAASDTGVLDTDDITNDATPTFTGTAEDGAEVTVTSSLSGDLDTVTAVGGNWSVTPSADITEGTHSITAAQTDLAGNSSPASGALAVTVDLAAAAPSVPDLEATSDTGISATDNITNDATPTFTGTAEDGAEVTVTSSLSGDLDTVTAVGGNWSVTPSADVTEGTHSITATQIDLAGNSSPASGALSVTVIVTPPAPPDVSGPASTTDRTPTWTWIGGSGNVRYGYEEGTWIAEDVSATDYTPPASLGYGSHTLYVQEGDDAGNWSTSGSFTITIERVPALIPPSEDGGCVPGEGPGLLTFALSALLACLALGRRRP